MAEERLKIKTAVYDIFERNGKILFLRRFNTGWSDGLYTLPAGHIDPGETPMVSAIREAKEEVCVVIASENIELTHVLYEQDEYIDFYFKVKKWDGELILGEPEKSDRMEWLDIEKSSDLIIPKVLQALREISVGKIYSEIK